MDEHPYRYRLFDIREMTSEEVELAIEVQPGETVRAASGRLMAVFAVVELEEDPLYVGILIAERVSG